MTLALRTAAAVGLAAAFALALAWPGATRAEGIEASNLRVRSEDPTSVTFSVRVAASAGLKEAELVYRVLNPKEGDVGGSVVREDFEGGVEFDISLTLETRTSQRYIPIGSQFRYHWNFTGADGESFVTEEQSYLFLDGRYPWVSVQGGDVTVHYYGTNHDRAERVLEGTRSSLEATERLLQVKVPYPVRVMVWASEDDGELAMRSRGAVFDRLVNTGGQRVSPDLLFVFHATIDVVRHEAAHIVTAVAGDGPFTRIPSWLDEGTAVYMQSSRLEYDDAVAFAIAADRTLRLRNLESPSNNPNLINIQYGQSWSVVDYMIEEFGEQQFADLFRVIREGVSTDSGLEQVYGVDLDGLYNLWRVAKGLDPIDYAPRAEATAAPVAEATRAPLAIPTSIGASGGSGDRDEASPTATSETASPAAGAGTDGAEPTAAAASAGGGGSNAVVGIAVGLVALLLAGALAGGAIYVARRPG